MNIERAYLNFTSLSLPTQWQLTKAKRQYLKEHNTCAVCGHNKDLEVHHIVPVHIDSSKAVDQDNFITLCDLGNKGCHYVFGHLRNFRTLWNPNIVEFAEVVRAMLNALNTSQILKDS